MDAQEVAPEQREVVLKALAEGYLLDEIAQASGLTKETVRLVGRAAERERSVRERQQQMTERKEAIAARAEEKRRQALADEQLRLETIAAEEKSHSEMAARREEDALQLGREWARSHLPFGTQGDFTIRIYGQLEDGVRSKWASYIGRGLFVGPMPERPIRRGSPPDRRWVKAAKEGKCPLSRRELEVLRHLSECMSYEEIAEAMCLATSTVRTFLHNAYGRLGVAGSAQAVVYAFKKGWIDIDLDHDGAAEPETATLAAA